MRISVGTTLWRTQGHPDWDKGMAAWHSEIDHLMWQARTADIGGFENLWLTEHHFSHHGSAGAPSVVLTHMAAITTRIRLGYGVALLPMHHPVRLAEEMCWVDHLSNGRLNIGVGRGHTNIEFAVFGATRETERDSFVEALTIIMDALSGNPVELHGTVWDIPYIHVTPGPYQRPHPPLHMVTTSEWSMRMAAKFRAAPILGVDPAPVLKQQLEQFRCFAAEEGVPEPIIDELASRAKCTRRLVVSRSRAEAEEEVLRGFAEADDAWLRYSKPIEDRSFYDPWVPATADTFRAGLKSSTPGKDLHHIFAGTPDDVVEQIRQLERDTGLQRLSTPISGMGIDRAYAERQADLLVNEVLPRV